MKWSAIKWPSFQRPAVRWIGKRWPDPRTWPPPPLRATALVTALLMAVPAVVLVRMPRPRAEGLGRLMPHAGLLQSFPAAPERKPPPLWRQRLDAPSAQLLWRQQRQLWWQFWIRDQAGGAYGAYLVMPLPRPIRVGALPAPPHSVQVDGLLVVASGPLAQRSLKDQLARASRRQRGLQQRCLEMLESEPAAYWSDTGIDVMAGPLAPLLQSLQEGCVALELAPGELLLAGEAGSARALADAVPPPPVAGALPDTLGEGLLLRMEGRSLDPLLQGLLSRAEVRKSINADYGLGDAELSLLKGNPFELRLRPQPVGPFQAGLELTLPVQGNPAGWTAILDKLTDRLIERGLRTDQGDDPSPQDPRPRNGGPGQDGPPQGSAAAAPLLSSTWRDDQGRVVGGWRWLSNPDQPLRLLLFLGPEPDPVPVASTPGQTAGSAPAPGSLPLLRLQARPQAMAALNLLPGQLPLPLLQARQLRLLAEGPRAPGSAGVSRLLGSLQLGEAPQIRPPGQPPAAGVPPAPPRP